MMHDAIVIGGGPAGATFAARMAGKGRSVIVLERERFPRFQIGESLLPYSNDIFERLGLSDRLERGGFVRKLGAEFVTGDGGRRHRFRFSNTLPERYSKSFQVRRADFDQILLDRARELGADAREGWRATAVDLDDPLRAVVSATDGKGRAERFEARFAVDASGYTALIGNRHGGRRERPDLRKIAVFGHYRGVSPSAPGDEAGNIVIVVLRNAWFWMIPVSESTTSVGLVVDRDELAGSSMEPAALLSNTIEETPYVAGRMGGAVLSSPVYVRKDFSYSMDRLSGTNFILIGDAAGFIDPIFSTGVMIAMKSGELAADGVDRFLRDGSPSGLGRYGRVMRRGLRRYERMIERFYRSEFIEVFLHPQKGLGLVSVVIALLAGNVFESAWDRWKLELFYALVEIQKRTGAVAPPISWENLPRAACSTDRRIDVG